MTQTIRFTLNLEPSRALVVLNSLSEAYERRILTKGEAQLLNETKLFLESLGAEFDGFGYVLPNAPESRLNPQ